MSKLWNPGDPISSPVDKMTEVDPEKIGQSGFYKLMIGGIIPRPIAFVSTISPEGNGNLAPFSFFNAIASNPPTLMISVTPKPNGEKKDTLRNIEATGQFVVNSVSEWILGPMNQCSAEYPYGVNEMEKVGLTPVPSVRIKPSRVKESPIQFECEVLHKIQIGDNSPGSSTLIVGKILLAHVYEKAYQDGKILAHEIKPIARLGGLNYSKLGEIISLPRP